MVEFVFFRKDEFVHLNLKKVILMKNLFWLGMFLFISTKPTGLLAAQTSLYRSQSIYRQLCASCHGSQGEGNYSVKAPALAGLPHWYVKTQLEKFKNGIRGKHPQDVGGLKMYPIAKMFSDKDISEISEFVGTFKKILPEAKLSGDFVKGQQKYATCVACHGITGEGNQTLNSPPLTNMSDWYLFKQLKAFQSGLRGADASKDPTGAIMAPMARTLKDEKDMLDVISYLRTLQEK